MTQRPRHLVNESLELTDEALPETTVDLELSATRIQERHGEAAGARYRHFIGRAVAAAPAADRDDLLTLAALAAWRSGAPAFRTDALRRLDLALAAGRTGLPALAAALGLGEGEVAPFAALQLNSRFGWPGLHAPGELLAVIGGFRGLYGPWLAPPVAALPGDRPGSFLIRTGSAATAEDWLLTVDVFGHTLVRLATDEQGNVDAAADARWSAAGDTAQGLAETGAAGAVLTVRAYTAQLWTPEESP
ncbi:MULTISPECIES: hypothetical protein [unclassified Cryobacterium]|uniref:hypothetical protein n=1 Tax=unclassified Cryobacterium TaxID=2649013 RepID=UPI00106AD860|nr:MULTISPECIES: hypothetical protein [unclassified Cryobacterium]TFC50585.1 hypothetical protein E3O68_17375 [Cryobacterium sp. TMB3-1-2]TFC74199.1 hypothetical protein E3T22_14985 [Cryobacterium sp. TMB3-10]TFC74803.1 hypothetical protein E3T21_01390 [Cryobacterium sp. TMB3-15]TFC88293.1 hypothetical protein E3T19_10890 [Cryobacterium sp. TMT4-31]TFD41045.1 hypothetical protein E3T58_11920 [Cryobacterium sp. TMB3-12]